MLVTSGFNCLQSKMSPQLTYTALQVPMLFDDASNADKISPMLSTSLKPGGPTTTGSQMGISDAE